jgi:hypothetical protein
MLKSALTIAKTEPVLITGAVQAILALILATGANLTVAQSGAILAATTAALAAVAAAAARPVQVPALTGLVTAVVTLLAAFGVNHVQPGLVNTLNGTIVAIMALVLRQHVTPVAALNTKAAGNGVSALHGGAQSRSMPGSSPRDSTPSFGR